VRGAGARRLGEPCGLGTVLDAVAEAPPLRKEAAAIFAALVAELSAAVIELNVINKK
jgi:hypothetical protein